MRVLRNRVMESTEKKKMVGMVSEWIDCVQVDFILVLQQFFFNLKRTKKFTDLL